jgi:formylglycine-generating enzyme required for sulfatase activity
LPNNCEQSANCCWSTVVPGGSFLRSNDPAYPATVSKFRMDLYEVTVGRFRKFVNAGKGTQMDPPAVGSGAHPKVPDSGWQAAWSLLLPLNTAALSTAITCNGNTFATWTENATTSAENRPINCVTWYEAFAFCVWDGGRLATEAEWNYAAAGGSLQRKYPWSMPPDSPKLDCSHSTWDCGNNTCGNGAVDCQNTDILAVGTKLAGTGRWGQMDLSGNVREWTFDWYGTYITPCTDCLQTTTPLSTPTRTMRGGHYQSNNTYIETKTRDSATPSYRGVPNGGIRCVRDLPAGT